MSIVEKMARAVFEQCHGYQSLDDFVRHEGKFEFSRTMADCLTAARAAITATGLTEDQLEGLANGTMVCVPVEPTEAMIGAMLTAVDTGNKFQTPSKDDVLDAFRGMLAAKEQT